MESIRWTPDILTNTINKFRRNSEERRFFRVPHAFVCLPGRQNATASRYGSILQILAIQITIVHFDYRMIVPKLIERYITNEGPGV